MKTIKLFFISFFFAQFITAQVENVYKQNEISMLPKYYQDFLNFISEEKGKTRVDIFIQVPYEEIQFVKSSKGFSAAYTITVSVYEDEDKEKLLVEKAWKEKIDAISFEQTVSKNNYNLSLRSFQLTPDKYFITTSVEDEDSRKKYSSDNIFTVRDLTEDLSVSDLMLVSKKTQAEGSNKILPNVSRNITSKRDGLPMFFEIYSEDSQEVKIEFKIKNVENDVVHSESINKQIEPDRTQVIHTINNISLGLGSYMVLIEVYDLSGDKLAEVQKNFISRWVGIPTAIQDLDKAIDQLVYIATPTDLSSIEEAETQDEKIVRYLDFWKQKDPTPNTEENELFNEYYRRISYANENFSHYIEGWRSDRGMVFIILGSPNNVDRHPFDLESKPYEVWQYYELNRSFVFVDETGFGDYRLITPLYGDDFRFRN
ncbi:MAG: GWxTD domain-containing protein [Ignavibacteriales bacterium]|nr:MAG: GWxTD domain-containing protein [Ignavibacteriales bacterium]